MPPLEVDDLCQDATLWERTGYDDYGHPLLAAPVDIRVRWEYKRTETVSRTGSPVAIEAVVVVNRDVPVDSVMWLGTHAQWLGVGSAGSDSELMMVESYEEIPDEKARVIRRTLGLIRYKDELPTGDG